MSNLPNNAAHRAAMKADPTPVRMLDTTRHGVDGPDALTRRRSVPAAVARGADTAIGVRRAKVMKRLVAITPIIATQARQKAER